jgi:hypothetical protein
MENIVDNNFGYHFMEKNFRGNYFGNYLRPESPQP